MNSPAIASQPPASACCGFDLDALRALMRDEFGARGQRDLAVAEAVAGWYTRQHPELLLVLDQPNLPGIIAGIAISLESTPPMNANQLAAEEIFNRAITTGTAAFLITPQVDIWKDPAK